MHRLLWFIAIFESARGPKDLRNDMGLVNFFKMLGKYEGGRRGRRWGGISASLAAELWTQFGGDDDRYQSCFMSHPEIALLRCSKIWFTHTWRPILAPSPHVMTSYCAQECFYSSAAHQEMSASRSARLFRFIWVSQGARTGKAQHLLFITQPRCKNAHIVQTVPTQHCLS